MIGKLRFNVAHRTGELRIKNWIKNIRLAMIIGAFLIITVGFGLAV